jgi:hypothetical protein
MDEFISAIGESSGQGAFPPETSIKDPQDLGLSAESEVLSAAEMLTANGLNPEDFVIEKTWEDKLAELPEVAK